MNRKQLQDWLNQFPEDAEINIVVEKDNPRAYGVRTINLEVFNGDDNQYHYVDYSLYGEVFKPNGVNEERHLTLGDY